MNKTNGINNRNLYIDEYKVNSNNSLYPTKLTLVADGIKTISDGTQTYSARAGDSEEVKFSYIYRENKVKNASNLIRGLYGSYVGINGYSEEMKIVDIHIPGYDSSKIKDYFEIRYNDKSSYYAISDRIDIQNVSSVNMDCYRCDCFICNYTQRINRNFQDIEAPNNDLIIDETIFEKVSDNTPVSVARYRVILFFSFCSFVSKNIFNKDTLIFKKIITNRKDLDDFLLDIEDKE